MDVTINHSLSKLNIIILSQGFIQKKKKNSYLKVGKCTFLNILYGGSRSVVSFHLSS